MVLDKMFRMPPAKAKAKDGSGKVIVAEHRVGRALHFFTQEELLRRTGLEKEWSDSYRRLDRKITNKRELEEVTNSMYTTTKNVLRRMVHPVRKYWNRVYEPQSAIVRATFVPVDDKGGLGFYIQALVDRETKSLLVGDQEDLGLWNEVTAIREKSHVEMWEDAMSSAKQLLKLPGLNKDLHTRMRLVLSGEVPSSVSGLLPAPDEE